MYLFPAPPHENNNENRDTEADASPDELPEDPGPRHCGT
jgi:hypothetical protein